MYLVFIEVLQDKIVRSRHRVFLELHLWSLPVVALIGMMIRLYGTLKEGVPLDLVLSMMLHLFLMIIVLIGCVVERFRKSNPFKEG